MHLKSNSAEEFASLERLPGAVQVEALVYSRYDPLYAKGALPCGGRPESWDNRLAGIDVVRDAAGRLIKLQSDGGQSPPVRGWKIILRAGTAEEGYRWTLYGFDPAKTAS